MADQNKPQIIKTPIHNIPIGEAVKNPDGNYSLRIKKPKESVVEEIALDKLLSMIVNGAEGNNKQSSRF